MSTALTARELQRQGLAIPIVIIPRLGDASRLNREYGLATKHLGLRHASAQSLRGTRPLCKKVLALPAAVSVMLRGARALRELQPDIIHTNDDQAILIWGMLARASGIPVVWHVRRMTATSLDAVRTRLANAMIYVSRAAASRLANQTDPPLAAVIYNGFDFADLTPLSMAERADIRLSIGVPLDSPLVGFVARLTETKRPQDFVAAALQTLRDVPSAHFALVGGGRTGQIHTQKLFARVEAAGTVERFHFLGHRDDATTIMGAFDALVLPSQEEGFGRAVVEAMARGIPVIGSDIGGIKEIINRPGSNGLLVPVGDVDAFAAAIVMLLQNAQLRRAIAQEGRRSAQQRFDITSVTQQIAEKIYQPLLSELHDCG